MIDRNSRMTALSTLTTMLVTSCVLTASTIAQEEDRSTSPETPLSDAIQSAPADVQKFNEHVIILASPWMEGRLPGTRGMELAREYVEAQYISGGLTPPVFDESTQTYGYRQSFPLGEETEFANQRLSINNSTFNQGIDFEMTGLGTDAGITAPISFVGYSISSSPDESIEYSSFNEDDDLSGRIAVLFRFEPMDEEGNSLWSNRNWSSKATFSEKFGALAQRNPAGVILVNPPGANDRRANELMTESSQLMNNAPVFMVTPAAAEKILQANGDERTIMEWRELADSGEGGVVHLDGPMLTMEGSRKTVELNGENIVGLVPGRGDLADEYIVIGAHMDHLGMGDFGSREGPGALHPGADDNASGTAAVIMLGESLREAYEQEPEDASLRTIVLIAFDGEESGLNGSRHYVRNPLFPIENHVLMINFDMIGRIDDTNRLSISGTGTGEGMSDWATPFFEASNLEIVASERSGGGSDHSSFMRENIPVLFGITPFPLHDDYHTSRDTVDKINYEGGAETVTLFHELAFDAAKRPTRFAWARSGGGEGGGRAERRPRVQMPKVRLGIRSTTDEDEPGLRIVRVSEGLSADSAGIQTGDRLLKWNDNTLETRRDLIDQLSEHEPKDIAEVIVLRDGEEMTIEIVLQPRESDDG